MKRLSTMLLLLLGVVMFGGACAPTYVASPGYYGRPARGWQRPRSAVVVVTPPPPPRVVVYRPGWR